MNDYDPERIGAVRFTFTYDTPQAAKAAWERAAKRVRFLSIYRHALDGDLSRQAVTVLAEDDEKCRPQVLKARRLLKPGREGPVPEYVFQVLRMKRLQTLLEVGLQGGGHVRRKVRFGEQGAEAFATGEVRPRSWGRG